MIFVDQKTYNARVIAQPMRRFGFARRLSRLLLSLLAVVSFSAFSDDAVIVVEPQSQPHWLEFDATIEAVNSGTVSAQTSGRIVALNYQVNDFVAAGSTLLEITSKEQSANVDAATAELSRADATNIEAQLTLQRLESLFSTGAVAQGQLDQARASAGSAQSSVKAAQANLIRAKEAVGYTRVKAPYAGVVTARHVSLGETVSPGQPLYTGFALAQMRAVADIPQRYLPWLDPQTEFVVTLADGSQLRSRDAVRFSFADQNSHAFKVRVHLHNLEAQLSPGMLVKVAFSAGDRKVLQVPRSALLRPNALTAVYRDAGGKWVLTQVRTGRVEDDQIEILSGLIPGDRIARSAYAVLQEGDL
ncbi:MAG: efflux RND transporter periplasmic adaptor subunit [Motiliproteus sp.]